MKSTVLLLIVLVASTMALPLENDEREYSRAKRSYLGGFTYPAYGGFGYGYPGYGFAYPPYGYPYGFGGYGLYKGYGFGHGFYG